MTSKTQYSIKEDIVENLINSAEFQSLYPDPSDGEVFTLRANIRTSNDALIYLFISTFFSIWNTDNLIRNLGQYCYRYNYNGQWKVVQDFLEAKLQSPEEFINMYITTFGPHDFFGNFLPKSIQYKKYRLIIQKPYINKNKVNYPIRRRGYKDKGTLRINSDRHGIPPYKEREDRRKLVYHPLLEERKFSTD